MSRFWKFNSFVGTVGFALLVAGFYVGRHTVDYNFSPQLPGTSTASFSWIGTTTASVYLMASGLFSMAYLSTVTFLGFLAGFFRGPDRFR